MVARTVRGIEGVVAAEIQERALGRVAQIRHREVLFAAADPGPELLRLRTADDVFLLGAVVDGVGRTRGDLRRLARATRAIPASWLLGLRAACGLPTRADGVEVVASFLGRRNYGRFDLEDTVGEQLAAMLAVPYHSRRGGRRPPQGSASWRVTLEGERATIGLRVAARPLHRRAYRRLSVPGSLHPPLAAALGWLGRMPPGARVLDPCCGAGTLLIEACGLLPGVRPLGVDHDRRALRAALANSGSARLDGLAWVRADAARLPLDGASVDRVVANPPWGRRARPLGALAGHPERLWRELRRVLAPQGRAVVLVHDADEALARAAAEDLHLRQLRPVSLAGTRPAIAVLAPGT